MGVSIQFESHQLEFSEINEMEHDPDVLAFYDQPGRIKLTDQGKNSDRRVGAIHTLDFFVIRQDRAGWLECKMEERLEELAEDMPRRFVKESDGTWSCPPEEAYALNDYETLKQKPKQEVYIAFERQAKLEGLTIIPTYKTFWKRNKQRPAYEQVLKRQGKRAATQL